VFKGLSLELVSTGLVKAAGYRTLRRSLDEQRFCSILNDARQHRDSDYGTTGGSDEGVERCCL
jgi:hypothetical protein